MSIKREIILDKIEIRPGVKQIGVSKAVLNMEDGVEISRNFLVTYYDNGDDLSEEDELVQEVANLFWSKL